MNRLNRRPSFTRLGLGLLVLLASLGATTGCAFDVGADGNVELVDTAQRVLERTFPADVRLENLAGEVEIVQGSGSEVRVVAEIHAAGRSEAQTQQLLDSMEWREWNREGKAAWALSYPVGEHNKISYPRGNGSFFNYGTTSTKYLGKKVTISSRSGKGPVLYANLRIEVPSGATVGVRNVVGAIQGDSMTANLDLDTGSGDITLGDLQGNLRADTGSGDVKVGDVRGDADIDTGSGDVDVAGVEGDDLRIDTGSGDIVVDNGRVRRAEMDTGSGNITARDFDAEKINLDTGSGDIRLESPLNWARQVMADTGSGDVVIVADPNATFDLTADQGSGELEVGFTDADLIRQGRELVGAKRGDRHTRIDVDTGSGDVRLEPGR